MRIYTLVKVYARVALATAFLSSAADRFGLWGTYGDWNVSWGDFRHFVHYTGMVFGFPDPRVFSVIAWVATIAETVFSLGLLLGLYRRFMAIGSATLLLLYALALTSSFGIKSALDYSVFTASGAALLLAMPPPFLSSIMVPNGSQDPDQPHEP
jgi:putative oxidoreductase